MKLPVSSLLIVLGAAWLQSSAAQSLHLLPDARVEEESSQNQLRGGVSTTDNDRELQGIFGFFGAIFKFIKSVAEASASVPANSTIGGSDATTDDFFSDPPPVNVTTGTFTNETSTSTGVPTASPVVTAGMGGGMPGKNGAAATGTPTAAPVGGKQGKTGAAATTAAPVAMGKQGKMGATTGSPTAAPTATPVGKVGKEGKTGAVTSAPV
jgi:hypothetical protein